MHGERYQTVSWKHHGGWGPHGRDYRGFYFFPPLALLFGSLLLFALFHTGLWLPLLVGGLIFWGLRQRRHDFEGFDGWAKHKHSPMWGDWQAEDTTEKAKRDDIDYI